MGQLFQPVLQLCPYLRTRTHLRNTRAHKMHTWTFWSATQPCVALTSSVEVSGSPWQLYNGAGLIQSQGRTVGAETQRENWSGSETYSSKGWCVLAAACSVTEEKTFCLHSYPTFPSTPNLFFLLLRSPQHASPSPTSPQTALCSFTYFSVTAFSLHACTFLPFSHAPHFPLCFGLYSINTSYTLSSFPLLLSLPLPFRLRKIIGFH